jgi:hypothetical protein
MSLELIVPIEHRHMMTSNKSYYSQHIFMSSRFISKEYQMCRLTLDPVQVVDSLLRYRDCPTIIKKWGTKWLE